MLHQSDARRKSGVTFPDSNRDACHPARGDVAKCSGSPRFWRALPHSNAANLAWPDCFDRDFDDAHMRKQRLRIRAARFENDNADALRKRAGQSSEITIDSKDDVKVAGGKFK